MNIDQALINYFWDYGDTLEGLLFIDDNPGDKITSINIVPCDCFGNMEMIQFYQDEELIATIEMEELENICVCTNSVDDNIKFNNKVIFELKGFNYMRLFIDLDFELSMCTK